MRCKHCRRDLPENAVYCCWCGERQIKERKQKDEIAIPKARQLKSGMWNIELRAERQSITESTQAKAEAKARAIRAGFIERKKTAPRLSVEQMIEKYIDANTNILSPSTVRSYRSIQRTHFAGIGKIGVEDVEWQKWLNEKAVDVKPKTLANVWRLVTAAMNYTGTPVPAVKLPKIPKSEELFLDYKQIQVFVSALYGCEVELAALLALHSLRRSEIMALNSASFDKEKKLIHVRGSRVQGADNKLVYKPTNKSVAGTRDIPIMIPRLLELLPEDGDSFIVDTHPNRTTEKIHTVCKHAGLPLVGLHDLRRSMASLAYHLGWDERTVMQVGGWSDIGIVHKFYIKICQSDVSEHTKSMSDFYEFTNEFKKDT